MCTCQFNWVLQGHNFFLVKCRYKHSNILSDNEKTSTLTGGGKSTLRLRDVSVEDEGMYRCVYDAGWQGEVTTQCRLYVFS